MICQHGHGTARGRGVNFSAHATCDTREQSRNIRHVPILAEIIMTTFDEREKSYEKKFALDQDLKFRAESRRNKRLAEWAAVKLGISGSDVEEYIKAVRKADLAEAGDEDVVRKVKQDFTDKGLAVDEAEIRAKLSEFLAQAVREVEADRS